ncbi:MAG: putative endopeptidase [Halieaceae bacterium]|jgi:putative endopeptidase
MSKLGWITPTYLLTPMLLLLTGCQFGAVDSPADSAPAQLSGIEISELDDSVRPQDDFFRYVNGIWLDRTEIPGDRASYGTFSLLADQSEAQQLEILQELVDNTDTGTVAGKLGTIFRTYMDVDTIERQGLAVLTPELEAIDGISNVDELAAMFGYFWRSGVQAPFVLDVQPDFENSQRYLVDMWQGGLGLPNRDYYLHDTQKYIEIRDQYVDHIAEILNLVPMNDAADRAAAVYDLEHRMALAHWPLEDAQDPTKIMNKLTRTELDELSDTFPWVALFSSLQVSDVPHVVLDEPDYFDHLGNLMRDVPLTVWQDYLKLKLIKESAPVLPTRIYEMHFAFSAGVLAGLTEPTPILKRAARTVKNAMGEGLGEVYINRYFDPAVKVRMTVMVDNVRVAMNEKIGEIDWMSEATKVEAKDKLHKVTALIAYPDKWRDYSDLEIKSDDALGNRRRANQFAYALEVERLAAPVDRGEWGMSPQTVNAYYSALENKIVFPAAILQPPFFDLMADDAINYGGIGGTIGHEISHGFDDGGREFDGDGNLRKWWTEQDDELFKEKAAALVEQFDAFEPLPDLHVNGKATLGENIGDLSGLAIAYRAYQQSLGGEVAPVIDGLSGDQRFFIGYAISHRSKMRDEFLRLIVLSDSHSPDEYRVNGVLSNFEPFYRAFKLVEGDALYLAPEKRVTIW